MNWSETGGALMKMKPSPMEPRTGNQKYTGMGTEYHRHHLLRADFQ